jgi:hypothetical protein
MAKRVPTIPWLALALLLPACESALPHQRVVTESPWAEFADAKRAFDRIELEKTNVEALRELGFHPYRNDNVAILSYMDVFEIFVPNASLRVEETPSGIQRCIESRERCVGYRQAVLREFDREHGNFWSNFFQVRVKQEVAGWVFESTLVLVDDVVVYKLWEGNPAVLKRSERIQPLGPLNDLDIDVRLGFP